MHSVELVRNTFLGVAFATAAILVLLALGQELLGAAEPLRLKDK